MLKIGKPRKCCRNIWNNKYFFRLNHFIFNISYPCIITYETFRICIYIINTIRCREVKRHSFNIQEWSFTKISRFHYHKWAHSTSRFVWKALFLTSLQTSHKSCQQYINESKFLIRLPLMKGMFDARKNFCKPMYFDLSVYSKATPTPLKVRSLIKLHCNGKKVRDSCCLSLEGG